MTELLDDQLTDKASLFWESFDPFTSKGVPQIGNGFRETVPLDHIYVDPTINTREIDESLVDEYAENMLAYASESEDPGHWQRQWRDLPKIVQTGFLFGGFHTIQAAKQAFGSGQDIEVRVFRGGRHDAFLLATGENYEHGRRRTREEIRESVKRWLLDEEGKTWANRHIAEMCKTSVTTVGRIETKLSEDDSDYERPLRRRMMREGQEVWIDTEKIGGKSEEELPLIDMADAEEANKLTELMEQIDKLHGELHIWYSEGNDLSAHETHRTLLELRAEYDSLYQQKWRGHPLPKPEAHLNRLEKVKHDLKAAEELQEAATNIFYHRKVIQEWFDVGHWQKMSALAIYCRDYATEGNVVYHDRANSIFYELVSHQHQLPVELLVCPDSDFLRERDIDVLRDNEQLLAGTVTSLREIGIEVPTQPPKLPRPVDAGDDLDEDETPSPSKTPKAAIGAKAGVLDDDETPVAPSKPRVPTTQEFVKLNDVRDQLNMDFADLRGHCEFRHAPDQETSQLLSDFDIQVTRLYQMCDDLYTITHIDRPNHRKGDSDQ